MRRLALAVLGLVPSLIVAQEADDAGLVLDERAYVRSYYQFDWDRMQPQALKEAVGKDYLTKGDLRTLERLTKARLAFRKLDWEKEDWRDAISYKAEEAEGIAGWADSCRDFAERSGLGHKGWSR